jgi:hypothetical protein
MVVQSTQVDDDFVAATATLIDYIKDRWALPDRELALLFIRIALEREGYKMTKLKDVYILP